MKTTNRTSREAMPAAQSKQGRKLKSAKSPSANGGVVLVDFTAGERQRLEAAALALNLTPEQLIRRAVESKLPQAGDAARLRWNRPGLMRMETNLNRAYAMLDLLWRRYLDLRTEVGQGGEGTDAGLIEIVSDIQELLRADFKAAWDAQRADAVAITAAPQVMQALTLLAEWESETVEAFCLLAVQARMDGSWDDLCGAANGEGRSPEEKKWAHKFHARVNAVAPKDGWQISTVAERRAA